MDQELQEMHATTHPRTKADFFGRMLVISLLLHAICSTVLLLPPKGGIGGTSVSYLDMSMAAPDPTPVKEAVSALRKEAAPLPKTPAPNDSPPSELEKLQKGLQETLESAGAKPEALQQASFGLGITHGHFTTLADGRSLRNDMREYYLTMMQKFNEKWWLGGNGPMGGVREAVILVSVAREGAIVDKRLVRSSGNAAYDRAMLQALEAAAPLPPLPATYEGNLFKAPLRFVAPLNLLSPPKPGQEPEIPTHSSSSTSSSTRSSS